MVDLHPNAKTRQGYRGLNPAEWESVNKNGRSVKRPAGTTVAREGETDRSVIAIKKGYLDVVLHSKTGTSMTVGSHGPGQMVGEMAALDGEPRSASIIASTDVELVLMSRDGFLAVLETHPAMAIDLLTQASVRLRNLTKRHASRSNSLATRVASRLTQFADGSGSNKLNLTQNELASWVDATRESTSKELKILRDAGLIKTARGSITITDPERLRGLAEGI